MRVVAESSPLLLERNSVCFTTTRKGENRTSIDLEKVLEGHKITHSDHGLSRLPPMCLHEDGHFQCSFNRVDGRRVGPAEWRRWPRAREHRRQCQVIQVGGSPLLHRRGGGNGNVRAHLHMGHQWRDEHGGR